LQNAVTVLTLINSVRGYCFVGVFKNTVYISLVDNSKTQKNEFKRLQYLRLT